MSPGVGQGKITAKYAGTIRGKRACVEKNTTGDIQVFYTYDRFTNGSDGFWEYAVDQDSARLLNHFFSGQDALPSLKINAISANGSDTLWLATNKGLVRFNKRTKAWAYCNEMAPGQVITLSEGLVEDTDNTLWVSTNLGLALFDKTRHGYRAIYPPVVTGSSGPAKPTAELFLDSKRILWCTVNGSGVDFTALDKPKFQVFPIKEKNGEQFIPGSMAQDDSGVLWFGSNIHFLKKYYPGNPARWEETAEKIWKIADIPLKRLLVATMGKSSYAWDPLTKTKYPVKTDKGQDITFGNIYTTPSGEILGLPFKNNGGVWCIEFINQHYIATRIESPLLNFCFTAAFKDRRNQLYLAKEYTSLHVYTEADDSLKLQKIVPVRGEAKAFFEDDQYVWVGGEFGLCRIDKQDLSARLFEEKDGLPNNMVYAILPGGSDTLWLSTNKGIVRFLKDSLAFRQYSLADGLQDLEFNTKSFLKTNDGRLWFGGIKGVNVFRPAQIKDIQTQVNVRITNLLVNDQAFKLSRNVTLIDSLELSYQQNTISFNFVALEYSDPENNKLQYRLYRVKGRPYDDNWVSCMTAKGFARYSNLPPGAYVLHIRGANSDGVWNTNSTKCYIKIRPPFYLTTEFYVAVLLLVLGIAYFTIRAVFRNKLRVKNLQLREQRIHIEKQEALTQERNRIAAEMHDDFGSGLTAIQRISERAAANTPSPDARRAIENITTYSLELISNMREIIWAMSGKNDTLENLMAYISENAYRYLGAHNIEVDIIQPDDIPDVEMSGERRRNIYLAVKESLHNVVKHANATAVVVSFEMNGMLDIHVRDNGAGFKNNNLNGNGMGNMAKRMEDIGGKMTMENNGGAHLIFSVPIEGK